MPDGSLRGHMDYHKLPIPLQAGNKLLAKTCKNISKTSIWLDQVVNGTVGTQSPYTQEIHMKVGI